MNDDGDIPPEPQVPQHRRSWRRRTARRVLRMGRHRSAEARARGAGWRLITPLAFIAAGVLFVTSAVSAGGTDLRPGRYDSLTDLAAAETERVQRLQEQVAELTEDVERLSDQSGSRALRELQADVAALEGPAGLTPVAGPGLRVTLEDAPRSIRENAGDQVSNAIVHQQDIQAVVNALWAGGAEAMTLQGQRVISTTGIKCVGNTVLLHGVTYSPPYVVEAIGDLPRMQAALGSSNYIQAYLEAVEEWQLGWEVEELEVVEAPAFGGSTELVHARAAADAD